MFFFFTSADDYNLFVGSVTVSKRAQPTVDFDVMQNPSADISARAKMAAVIASQATPSAELVQSVIIGVG